MSRPAARGPRVAGVLSVLVGVVAVVLLGQVVWFVADAARDDGTVAVDTASAGGRATGHAIAVPDGRPVVLDRLAVRDGVAAAAKAATAMFARDWRTYDRDVTAATDLMTAAFAEEYRATTDDVEQEFVSRKSRVEVEVVARGVVRANEAELEALVFLDQYILRGAGKDPKTVVTPYRALLTMVHTDQGWFVDDVLTR